jgi:hypothetical protein
MFHFHLGFEAFEAPLTNLRIGLASMGIAHHGGLMQLVKTGSGSQFVVTLPARPRNRWARTGEAAAATALILTNQLRP